MNNFILSGPKVYTEEGIKSVDVCIHNGIIEDLKKNNKPDVKILRFPAHFHLIPGLIDLHVHGANHKDVMDGDLKSLHTLSQTLAAEGTTAFLATTMTAASDKIEKALLTVKHFIEQDYLGAEILGVHLEGPFISSTKTGAQDQRFIHSPSIKHLSHWLDISNQLIKLVTLAPELPNGLEFIRYLKQKNIIVSMGHSHATFAEATLAIEAGCHYATHLFNAMRPLHQREPGLIAAALLSKEVMVECIADGIHLHPAILQLIYQTKGKEKMILVTDSMRAKCLSDGHYDLGGKTVFMKNGIPQLADGTLAGSVLTLPTAIQNIMRYTQCDFFDAVKMASENPAKALGIFHKKGSIALNKEADLVVLDPQFKVIMTICRGRVVYKEKLLS